MARTVKVDMTGVESYTKASEGIHTAKVAEIEEKTSQGGDPMLQFIFEIIKGEDKGCKVFENFVLTDKALWRLKSFLIAIGMKADGKMKIDLDKLIGKICDIEVFHDEYNGTTRAKISDYYKTGKAAGKANDDEDEDDDDDEEEKPKAKKRGPKPKSKKKPEPEPDEDEDDEDDTPWDDDEDDDEEDEPPKKAKKAKKSETAKKGKGKRKPEPEPEPDEDEDDDDDEEWEEE